MKNIISVSLILLSAVLLTSCEKVVDVKLETSEPKPVIEGLVADQPGMSYVKLSISDSYFEVQNPHQITGAKVEITDTDGNMTVFSETSNGYYEPVPGFKGVVNKTYSLKVTINGKVFLAQSPMRKVTEIENIKTKFFDANNAEGKEKGYYVYVSFYELPGIGDSYKIDMYENGISKVNHPGDLFFFDDKYIDGGHAVDWDFSQKVEKSDTITLKMYSLTPEGFKFYTAIYNIAEAGGLFGKNPANIPTNIQGDAFGYFGASAVSIKSAIVE